jgi:heavy metal sensor kinase
VVRLPTTLRWRLTLWYIVLLGVPLIAFAGGGYFFLGRTLYNRTDRFIGDALLPFSREIVAERRAASGVLPAMRTTADEVRFRDLHIAIVDSAGTVVAMTPPAGEAHAELDRLGDDAWIVAALRGLDATRVQAMTVQRAGQGAYRLIATPLLIEGQRFVLTGSYSLRDIDAMLARMRQVCVVVIPLLIICAAIGGYFVTARSLAPVSSMAARAAEISTANLQERLPVGGSEEVVRLAEVVNRLLDRLEASFALQRRFMADASHELRTPTAIVRTEADVTLSRAHRGEDEYRASVGVMRDAARRLTRIVDDLFLLARSDAGNVVTRREALYLEEIVDGAVRAVRPLAAKRGVRLELSALIEAPFEGDADQLGRVLLNLLDNAIKHSEKGGTVDVAMARRGGDEPALQVSVVDAGQGIPAEAQGRVFDRFFRVDAARARAGGDQSSTIGAGLGLSIARRIAELHGGRVDLVESRPGRTEFRLSLPAAASGAQRPL